MSLDILNIANDIAETAPDLNETTSGGDYQPPAKGPCALRYVGYVEIGKQKRAPYLGKPKDPTLQAIHVFEVSGENYPPIVLEDGTKIPVRVEAKTNISSSEKGTHSRLFKAMNWDGKATHFSQLLGKAFLGNISHYEWKDGDKSGTKAQVIDGDQNISVRAPIFTDPIAGTTSDLSSRIPPPLSDLRLFVWNAKPEIIGKLWDSIYIPSKPGATYDANKFQSLIRKALNLKGSPIADFLAQRGESIDIPDGPSAEALLGAPETSAPSVAQSDTPAPEVVSTSDVDQSQTDAQNAALASLGL